MKVFAALLIDGVEDGPRVPAEIWFEQIDALNGKGEIRIHLENAITLGPASRHGVATLRFFLGPETEEFLILGRIGPLGEGQSINYAPDPSLPLP